MKRLETKKITAVAMLCSAAYIVNLFFRIPIQFLSFELKDVVLVITGFIFGPLYAFFASAIVAFVEMLTISTTGLIGFVMNIISSACFACTAAAVYSSVRTMKGAVYGLILGCVFTTAAMLMWNYFITPMYLGAPREAVVQMMIPLLLPFNLAKSIINASVALLLYKPVVTALRRAGLTAQVSQQTQKPTVHKGIILVSIFLIITGAICFVIISR